MSAVADWLRKRAARIRALPSRAFDDEAVPLEAAADAWDREAAHADHIGEATGMIGHCEGCDGCIGEDVKREYPCPGIEVSGEEEA